ncbi:MAG: mechanosensitive ion channel [Betaproteobacteria bacterium]|nr:mechanosensitive ion channel [Betaproteobacteria bacterium]
MNDQLRFLDHLTAAGVDAAIKFGPKVLVAVLILVAGYYAGRWAGRTVARSLERFHLEPPVLSLVERIAHLLVLALFAVMALQNLGVELLPLVAGLGIAGAGVALAMQGVLGNVVAGLTIIFSRPFRVGDYISIATEEGEVLDIELFNTTLGHPDLSRVVIPNRKIVGEVLHNYGQLRQLAIEVRVSYDTHARAAIEFVTEVLRANPLVLQDPVPLVSVLRLDDSGIVIGVAPWVKVPDYVAVRGQLYESIVEAFRARRIVIPIPQRDVRLISTTADLAGQGA